jgi:hypothetical protein
LANFRLRDWGLATAGRRPFAERAAAAPVARAGRDERLDERLAAVPEELERFAAALPVFVRRAAAPVEARPFDAEDLALEPRLLL